jgi:hypothetical protein
MYKKEPLDWMQMLVSQINSPHMEEIRFWLEVDFFHDLNQIDWHMLAELFAQPHFARLKKLHFDVQRFGWSNTASAGVWVRRRLPACDARGILSIYDMCPVRSPESTLGG